MHFSAALIVAFVAAIAIAHDTSFKIEARAELNGRCTGSEGLPGSCISTSSCSSGGGTYITGACPGLPNDIKCCTKKSCGNGGTCNWTDTCSGTTQTGLCPGPTNFKCCFTSAGGCTAERVPTSGCTSQAINGGDRIAAKFPCTIVEIGCKRKCNDGSDHCVGKATDLMVGAYGTRSTKGQPVAEWVMNNAASLGITYVIWGQKIWNKSRDPVGPWSGWRGMEDRGGNTANHWDHVHVSYA